jgi:hypothetical protein
LGSGSGVNFRVPRRAGKKKVAHLVSRSGFLLLTLVFTFSDEFLISVLLQVAALRNASHRIAGHCYSLLQLAVLCTLLHFCCQLATHCRSLLHLAALGLILWASWVRSVDMVGSFLAPNDCQTSVSLEGLLCYVRPDGWLTPSSMTSSAVGLRST